MYHPLSMSYSQPNTHFIADDLPCVILIVPSEKNFFSQVPVFRKQISPIPAAVIFDLVRTFRLGMSVLQCFGEAFFSRNPLGAMEKFLWLIQSLAASGQGLVSQ